jgi:hypothetical protein
LEGTVIDLERFHHQAHLQAALDIGLKLSLEEAIRKIPHFVGGPDETVAYALVYYLIDFSMSFLEIIFIGTNQSHTATSYIYIESYPNGSYLESSKSWLYIQNQ